MKPMIVESPLSRPSRWFVLTKYIEKDGIDPETGAAVKYLRAITKYDVTDQMEAILRKRRKRTR